MKKKDDRKMWQERLARAKTAYEDEISAMNLRDEYYRGTRESRKNPNSGQESKKQSTNVRNIIYELIESQVDSTIPMPRVEAIHEDDKDLANAIEAMLRNEITEKNFSVMNDLQERTVPIQGGSFWQVAWDSSAGTHCTLGDVKVTERHPKQVIPQDGVQEICDMDYIFVLVSRTKKSVERQYKITLQTQTEDEPEIRGVGAEIADDLVTQTMAYYRNSEGGIGLFSWVGEQTLEDCEDYQARRLSRCKTCGSVKTGAVCGECGGRSFEDSPEEYEELTREITMRDGTVIPEFEGEDTAALLDKDGFPILDEAGEPMYQTRARRTRIPYYNPKEYPIILRRNIRQYGKLLGASDADVIMDQQDTIKKLGSKIDEKCLKGGSFVTLPNGCAVETTDREFKVVRVKDAMEKSLIGVINVQPDCSRDMNVLEQNYGWAKSTLGITDAFQGKYDSSATSGTAKQFSANQSAGRLESKRRQKNASYASLYKLMFQYLLAYADQPMPYKTKNDRGEDVFEHFDRWAFLRRDAAGELYWDDEFLFSIDSAATLSSNRENLWNLIDVKYQASGFGPLNELDSQITLWRLLEDTDFPYAGNVRKDLEARKAQREAMQQAAMMGGGANALPEMQYPAGD